MFKLTQKLKTCRGSLVKWSRAEFGNNKLKLQDLKAQLMDVQAVAPSSTTDLLQKQIRDEIELLLDREEMFYHQRSRIRWLQYGDRNTSFFHASVIQRRQRNQLIRLKDDTGTWLTEEDDINHHLGGFYSDLFRSNPQRNMDEALAAISQVITPSMNQSLIRPVSPEETNWLYSN